MRNFLWLSLILLLVFGGRTLLLSYWRPADPLPQPVQTTLGPAVVPDSTPVYLPLPTMPPLPPLHPEIQKMIQKARSLEGRPYLAGGQDTTGFDCSGFVNYVYRDIGVVLPRSSSAMALVGRSIERQDVRPGDLLFFTGTDAESSEIGHVALVVKHDANRLLMIHASNRGVVIDDFFEMPYYQARYVSANRPYAK